MLVYIREAHGATSWRSTINEREAIELPDPMTLKQKRDHAASCVRKLNIPFVAAVDGLDNAVGTRLCRLAQQDLPARQAGSCGLQ